MAKYRLFQHPENKDLWAVEFMNVESEFEITVFEGPNSERRAAEYQAFKNGVLAKVVPSLAPEAAKAPEVPVVAVVAPRVFSSGPSFTINVVNDHSRNGYEYELVIYPQELDWTYDQRRRRLTAQPKDPIEILKKKDKGDK